MSKKIMFFCSDFIVGGWERILVTTCNLLADKEWDVLIVWTGYVEDNFLLKEINPKVKQFNLIKELNLKVSIKPKGSWFKRRIWKINRKINAYKLRNIKKYIKDFNKYEYLVDFKNGNSNVSKIKSYINQKKILWLHGSSDLFLKSSFIICNDVLNYDKIVCLTEEFKQDFINKYPKYSNKIIKIYNPCDINYIKKQAEEKNANILKYTPYFIHVSRLDNDKDIMTVINSCEILYRDQTKKYKMIFLGKGCNQQIYCDLIKQKKLADKIFFLGNSDNPYPWIKNAQAIILSSPCEGLPTVLIEGQALDTLCVSTNCKNGPKEILEDGKSGILFNIGDATSLAKIMADIEDQKVNKLELINNAKNSLFRFNKDNFFDCFERNIL